MFVYVCVSVHIFSCELNTYTATQNTSLQLYVSQSLSFSMFKVFFRNKCLVNFNKHISLQLMFYSCRAAESMCESFKTGQEMSEYV